MDKKYAEDNLQYGTKKYFKQSFKSLTDPIESAVKKGIDLTQSQIDEMSYRYSNIVKSDANKTSALKQMKSIVKEYMKNEKIKNEGKIPELEKHKQYKDI